ncbi:YcnI family protein [Nocardioides humilatus]|uniref:YcnI family protein n=1 Tax=Nocardioides humilatus TaxID=2607660 RepID=A0A5B1LDH6_9ACTN|nr:YcnI family protein [Nocardioides humilatus]KAA1418692.1 YcnI family protein [Nocardioides humilatus]
MHIRRIALPATAALGALALTVAPAAAHVTISPNTTAAGAYAVLTVSVPHGCDGSATTEIAIKLPEEIYAVTPTRNPFWTVEKVMQTLDEPITDAHGNEITERVDQVVYTANTPLPDGQRDAFELSLQLPDAAGETLAFPIVQTCEKGETGWTEEAADGQDPEELEHPAPLVTITEADGEGHHGGDMDGEEHRDKDADHGDKDADKDDEDGNGLALAGLATGILGIVIGGVALARSRKA